MKRYSLIVSIALIIAVLVIIILILSMIKPEIKEVTSTLEVLHSDQLSFLVTDRVVTQVVVTIDNTHWLTGVDKALLYTVVTIYYGVDLEKITQENISENNDTVWVTIPEPELLDISVDLEGIQIFESRSGLIRLIDVVKGENKVLSLLADFQLAARVLAEQQDLFPSREKMLIKLNSFAPLFSEKIGKTLIFQ